MRWVTRILSLVAVGATPACLVGVDTAALSPQTPAPSATASPSELEAADAELAAQRPRELTVRIEGHEVARGDSWNAAIRDHATTLIGCAEDRIVVRSMQFGDAGAAACTPGTSATCWTIADGCGQRLTYASKRDDLKATLDFYVTSRFRL